MSRPIHASWQPLLLATLLAPTAAAQITFSDRTITEDRRDSHAAAYDPAQGRVVQFGGLIDGKHIGTTAAYDGQGWIQLGGKAPAARQNAMFCQHPSRGSLLLFGGRASDGSLFSDTWGYRDGIWSPLGGRGPSARWLGAMVHDAFRGVSVLHGGGDASGPSSETWEYDGRAWSAQTKSGPKRTNHAMAYDSRRRVTVLFGGWDLGSQADHWEYSSGKGWVQVPIQSGPPARHNHAMCFDAARGRVVLFGGKDDVGRVYDDLWEFDGRAWHAAKPAAKPAPRELCALTYDEGRKVVVLTGGDTAPNGNGTVGDVWEWDGTVWKPQQRTPPAAAWIPAVGLHAMAYDVRRNQTVVHGGLLRDGTTTDATWVYDGTNWYERNVTPAPSLRTSAGMVDMLHRARLVLFGGLAVRTHRNDTWEWDGSAWTQVVTANAPDPRSDFAMAYDARRQRVVLFGGMTYTKYLGDTWEYDGTNWTQRTTASDPGLRSRATMCYDARRGRIVLWGGGGPNVQYDDTWEYDGVNWVQVATTTRPPFASGAMAFDTLRNVCVLAVNKQLWEFDSAQRTWVRRNIGTAWPVEWMHSCVYDEFRRETVVVGGQIYNGIVDIVATWDGNGWGARPRLPQPAPRTDHEMVYEPSLGRALLFGGHDGVSALQDTWSFDGEHWRLENPVPTPPQRYGFALTTTPFVDPRFGTVWMTGGRNGLNQFHADGWVWDPSRRGWKALPTTDALLVRENHAMSRYAGGLYPLLFGGLDRNGVTLNDTVVFDGTRWISVPMQVAPSARDLHAMAYDDLRRVVVLFGGRDSVARGLADTWEFDGLRWKQVATPLSPPARWNHTLVFDRQRGRMVLTGGRDGLGPYLGDVWEYDGTQWVPRVTPAVAPAPRWNAAAAFDVRRMRMVLHGGGNGSGRLADTHEYFAPTDVGTFAAWAGAQPLTVLTAPILGSELRVQYEATAGAGVLMIQAGASNRSVLTLTSPAACETSMLHIDLLANLQIPGTGSPCVSASPIPNDLSLLGWAFSAQGIGVNLQPCLKLSLPLVFTMRAR